MKILALISHTFRELAARLTLIVLAGISTLILLVVALSVSSSETADGKTLMVFGNPSGPPVSADQFARLVQLFEATAAGGLFLGVIVFGVFATAGIIPDTLERGIVDLYLSKPIARWQLLLGRTLGAIAVMLANVLYFIGGLWLIMGARLGVWNTPFLLSAFTLTLVFSALYSVVVFLGVATRNTAIAIIGAFLYLIGVAALLYHRESFLFLFSSNTVYRGFFDVLYALLPQTSAMQDAVKQQIMNLPMDWKPFAQSVLSSAAIFLCGACVLRKRDF